MEEKLRIDKWLHAVRIYKTRSIAAEECSKGRVMLNDASCKPSREIKVGDKIRVRKGMIETHYKVKKLSAKRMGAPLVQDFLEDITPLDIVAMQTAAKAYGFETRDRGTGRPTKRDRRMIDKLKDREEYDDLNDE